MRKTQVALAALALVASSAAMAEGVAIYGQVDASLVHTGGGTSFAGAGNNTGSLWGIKGSSDLGGGLKGGFNLESGIDIATGALGANGGASFIKSSTGDYTTTLFNRAANVSLSNENVSLTLGTQISPFIASTVGTGSTAVGGNGVFVPGLFKAFGGTLAGIDVAGTANGGFFIAEAAAIGVNANGISANYLYRFNKSATAADNNAYSAASIGTSVVGINLGLAYQSVGEGTNVKKANNYALSANTEVAGIRVNAVISSNEVDAVKSTGYLVGASMPVYGALSAGLTFADNSKLAQGSMTSVSAQYALSKSTFAYATYSAFSDGAAMVTDKGAFANSVGSQTAEGNSLITVGVAHSF